jgi:hypothetical protein
LSLLPSRAKIHVTLGVTDLRKGRDGLRKDRHMALRASGCLYFRPALSYFLSIPPKYAVEAILGSSSEPLLLGTVEKIYASASLTSSDRPRRPLAGHGTPGSLRQI